MDAAMGALGLGIMLNLRDNASNMIDKVKSKIQGLSGASQEMIANFDTGTSKILGGAVTLGAGALVLTKAFSSPIRRNELQHTFH
jgi:hypothetical protein